jgi:hypothetical protein
MIAHHPKTGKEVRIIKSEGAIHKNAKTLVWLDTDAEMDGYRWDVGTSNLDAWYYAKESNIPVKVVILMGDLDAAEEWLVSGLWKTCTMVAASSAVLDKIGMTKLASLGISNMICLEEMANVYPYLETPWDGTEMDARALVSVILHYTRSFPVTTSRSTTEFGLTCSNVMETPPQCVLITQYYKPSNPRRAKEVDTCLRKNVDCRYIDKIILLGEKIYDLPVASDKIEQHVIGERLRFNIVIKWIYDHVNPNTHVVIANSDIYMDHTLGILWSINTENVFFSLLRWDDADNPSAPPKMFGPRSDSQDTWIVNAKSVKERKWDWSTIDFPFGKGGCDNAFTIEMFRQKFLVVNPALNLVTHHVHNSGIRNYDPADIVEKPVLMYVHPSGVHDLRPVLAFNQKPIHTYMVEKIPLHLNGSYTSNQYATCMKMLSKAEVDTPPAYKAPIYEFSNVFQTASGLLRTHTDILIGPSKKSNSIWAEAELSVTAACVAVDVALVAYLSDEMAADPVKYMYYYLGKIIALHKLSGGVGEWLASENMVETMHLFSWNKEEMPLISRNKHYETWCRKAYAWLPQENDAITRVEVEGLRTMLNGGWQRTIDAKKRYVCVIDDHWVTEAFTEGLEASAAVSCLYPSTSVSTAVSLLRGASDVVIFGRKNTISRWGLFWALPEDARVHEIQLEIEPSLDIYSMCQVAELKHILHIVPRLKAAPKDIKTCLANILTYSRELPCIRVPHSKTTGFFAHSGDSFREMVDIWVEKGYVSRKECVGLCNIWLGNTMLYDRPTFDWLEASPPHEQNYGTLLTGNPYDGRPKSMAWSFWPRRPRFVEEFVAAGLHETPYEGRERSIVFYGRSENKVQKQRRTEYDWSTGCSEYIHVDGTAPYPFDQKEYLRRLSQAKWGLCLPGYGQKCHREIECMAMGCVPIVSSGVDMDNYADPPKEGVHYIRVENPGDMAKVATISKEVWETMSVACHLWWKKNASAEGMWRLTEELAKRQNPDK